MLRLIILLTATLGLCTAEPSANATEEQVLSTPGGLVSLLPSKVTTIIPRDRSLVGTARLYAGLIDAHVPSGL